jgi:thiosulfate dehydrogenase [quinone] large subunit
MNHHIIEEPKFAQFVLQNPKFAWFWLIVRVYVGWQWLEAGWEKIHSVSWVGQNAGVALTGFLNGSIAKVGGAHPDVQSWYGWFLQNVVLPHASLWSYFVAYGEFLVGVALILGFLTGIAAFFGFFMNLNYILAGTVSTNPILFVLALGLILAWRVAGFLGLDYWLLPALGTPWHPGTLAGGE